MLKMMKKWLAVTAILACMTCCCSFTFAQDSAPMISSVGIVTTLR